MTSPLPAFRLFQNSLCSKDLATQKAGSRAYFRLIPAFRLFLLAGRVAKKAGMPEVAGIGGYFRLLATLSACGIKTYEKAGMPEVGR